MQTHIVIENIFDKNELAKHIAQLTALMQLGEQKIETVVHTVKIDGTEAAQIIGEGVEQIKQLVGRLPSAHDDEHTALKMAHEVFGTGNGSATETPLPPNGASSTADAAPSTTAPAAPQATSAPPPPVAAPAPPAPSVAATRAPVETDKNGYTWDESIHAGTKTKNADGTWRYKRGVHESLVTQVEAAQRAARGAVPGPVTVTIDPAPGAGDRVTIEAAVTTAPAPPPPTTGAPEAPGVTFGQLVARTQKLMASGGWQVLDMQNALKSIGLPDFPSLKARPDLFAQFDTLLATAELGAM